MAAPPDYADTARQIAVVQVLSEQSTCLVYQIHFAAHLQHVKSVRSYLKVSIHTPFPSPAQGSCCPKLKMQPLPRKEQNLLVSNEPKSRSCSKTH